MNKIEIPGFHKRLNNAIKKSGMGVRGMARETGIADSSISRYCSGQQYPDIGRLAILCETLDVSADYLLFGKSTDQETKET